MRLIDVDKIFENGVVRIHDDAIKTATEILDKINAAPTIVAVEVEKLERAYCKNMCAGGCSGKEKEKCKFLALVRDVLEQGE